MLTKTQLKSHTITIYHKFIEQCELEELAFVDAVYDLCEKKYDCGGDVVIECYEPREVLEHFKTLEDVRRHCGLVAEQACNCRWGEDSDPELGVLDRFDAGWRSEGEGI